MNLILVIDEPSNATREQRRNQSKETANQLYFDLIRRSLIPLFNDLQQTPAYVHDDIHSPPLVVSKEILRNNSISTIDSKQEAPPLLPTIALKYTTNLHFIISAGGG